MLYSVHGWEKESDHPRERILVVASREYHVLDIQVLSIFILSLLIYGWNGVGSCGS